jgi:hypothetical protein
VRIVRDRVSRTEIKLYPCGLRGSLVVRVAIVEDYPIVDRRGAVHLHIDRPRATAIRAPSEMLATPLPDSVTIWPTGITGTVGSVYPPGIPSPARDRPSAQMRQIAGAGRIHGVRGDRSTHKVAGAKGRLI